MIDIILVKYIGFTNKTILFILLVSKVNILYKWYYHNNIIICITKTNNKNDDITLK